MAEQSTPAPSAVKVTCMIDHPTIKKKEVDLHFRPLCWSKSLSALLFGRCVMTKIHQQFPFLSAMQESQWTLCINGETIDKSSVEAYKNSIAKTPAGQSKPHVQIIETAAMDGGAKSYVATLHFNDQTIDVPMDEEEADDIAEETVQQEVCKEAEMAADRFRAPDQLLNNKKIYVNNIPTHWDEKRLTECVQQATPLAIATKSIKSSPYGKWACIAFYEAEHAAQAIVALNGLATGDAIHAVLYVSKFMSKKERDSSASAFPPYHQQQQQQPQQQPAPQQMPSMSSLYVANLPATMTEAQLQQLFASFGKIRMCPIFQKTADFRYGFVNFVYAEDATRALSMNGHKVGDKSLQVKWKHNRHSRVPQPLQQQPSAASYYNHYAPYASHQQQQQQVQDDIKLQSVVGGNSCDLDGAEELHESDDDTEVPVIKVIAPDEPAQPDPDSASASQLSANSANGAIDEKDQLIIDMAVQLNQKTQECKRLQTQLEHVQLKLDQLQHSIVSSCI